MLYKKCFCKLLIQACFDLPGDNFMEAGGLFEDPPMPDVSLAQEPDPSQVPLSQKEGLPYCLTVMPIDS